MAAKTVGVNGGVKWVAIGLTVLGSVAAIVLGYGGMQNAVDYNTEFRKTDGAKNTKHRLEDEKTTEHMNSELGELKVDFKTFTQEQRAVNKELLGRVRPVE
jgi:hypothetical protein